MHPQKRAAVSIQKPVVKSAPMPTIRQPGRPVTSSGPLRPDTRLSGAFPSVSPPTPPRTRLPATFGAAGSVFLNTDGASVAESRVMPSAVKPKNNPTKKKNPLNFSSPNPIFVTIIVGKENQKFSIHMEAITHHSPFFRNAFNSPMTEGTTLTMALPEIDPSVFGLFNNWIYTQQIEHSDSRSLRILELAKLWTYADRFLTPSLQNDAMGMLFSIITAEREAPVRGQDNEMKDFFNLAYSPNVQTALGQLAVDRMVRLATFGLSIEDWIQDFPSKMMVDILKSLTRKLSKVSEKLRVTHLILNDYLVSTKSDIEFEE